MVSRKGIKRERGACTPAQCRGCPRNCKRRASDLIATGSLRASGKVVDGDDPRARRPATAGSHARAQQAGCPDVAGPVAPSRSAVGAKRRQFAVTESLPRVFSCPSLSVMTQVDLAQPLR